MSISFFTLTREIIQVAQTYPEVQLEMVHLLYNLLVAFFLVRIHKKCHFPVHEILSATSFEKEKHELYSNLIINNMKIQQYKSSANVISQSKEAVFY